MESEEFDYGKKNENSILGQLNMKTVVLDLLLVGRKITDWKLGLKSRQYVAWIKAIQFFFHEVGMFDHLTQEPPTNSTKAKWIMDD